VGFTLVTGDLLLMISFARREVGKERTARMISPILPPELRYVTDMGHSVRQGRIREKEGFIPFRSVDTPVEKRPREATAREPPRSTMGL
jgi:hypothetical protein